MAPTTRPLDSGMVLSIEYGLWIEPTMAQKRMALALGVHTKCDAPGHSHILHDERRTRTSNLNQKYTDRQYHHPRVSETTRASNTCD